MSLKTYLAMLWLLPMALTGVSAVAEHTDQHGGGNAHLVNMPLDASLSLVDAVAAAGERLRLGDWARQREQVAESRRKLGAAWLGDVPSIGGTWRDYDWNNDSDFYEAELYLAMPLWHLGERKANRDVAEKDASLVPLQSQARALATAAQVREAYWQLLDSRTRIELLQQLLESAERYAQQMTMRMQAGDVARTDLLQSRQRVFDLRSRLLDAQTQLVDSSRYWRLITGLEVVPARAAEQLTPLDAITEQHPLLQLAAGEVDLLRTELAATRNSGSLRPAVMLNVKRENFDEQVPPVDSIGVGINIPLGRGKANGVAVARSEQALLEGEVAMQNLRRQLEEDLHEVRHQAHVNEANIADSKQLVDIAEQVYQMQQLANEQGEITVIEVLRAAQDLAEARQRFTLLTLTRDALVARHNQVLGVLPQ